MGKMEDIPGRFGRRKLMTIICVVHDILAFSDVTTSQVFMHRADMEAHYDDMANLLIVFRMFTISWIYEAISSYVAVQKTEEYPKKSIYYLLTEVYPRLNMLYRLFRSRFVDIVPPHGHEPNSTKFGQAKSRRKHRPKSLTFGPQTNNSSSGDRHMKDSDEDDAADMDTEDIGEAISARDMLGPNLVDESLLRTLHIDTSGTPEIYEYYDWRTTYFVTTEDLGKRVRTVAESRKRVKTVDASKTSNDRSERQSETDVRYYHKPSDRKYYNVTQDLVEGFARLKPEEGVSARETALERKVVVETIKHGMERQTAPLAVVLPVHAPFHTGRNWVPSKGRFSKPPS